MKLEQKKERTQSDQEKSSLCLKSTSKILQKEYFVKLRC